jgi:hypothetical protein
MAVSHGKRDLRAASPSPSKDTEKIAVPQSHSAEHLLMGYCNQDNEKQSYVKKRTKMAEAAMLA